MLSSIQNHRIILLHHRCPRHCLPTKRRFITTTSIKCLHTNSQASPISSPSSPTSPTSQILTIRESLLSRSTTAVELAHKYLANIQRTEPLLKSFLHLSPHDAVQRQAQEIDRKIQNNEEVGPMAGVLVAVKDNICTADMPSTAGSKILEGYCPPFDATAVWKLKKCGAIIVGKTNMDEFGMGSTTEASAFQV